MRILLALCVQGVVKVLDIGAKEVDVVAPLLKDLPDIIVGTPGDLQIGNHFNLRSTLMYVYSYFQDEMKLKC